MVSNNAHRWRHPWRLQGRRPERLRLQHHRQGQRRLLPLHLRWHRWKRLQLSRRRQRLVVQSMRIGQSARRLAPRGRQHRLDVGPPLGHLENSQALFPQGHQDDDQVCVRGEEGNQHLTSSLLFFSTASVVFVSLKVLNRKLFLRFTIKSVAFFYLSTLNTSQMI